MCSQDLTLVPSLCVSYKSFNWAHTLETLKGEREWKKGNQQVWRMRNPKEKQGNVRGAVCQGRRGQAQVELGGTIGIEECTASSKFPRSNLS